MFKDFDKIFDIYGDNKDVSLKLFISLFGNLSIDGDINDLTSCINAASMKKYSIYNTNNNIKSNKTDLVEQINKTGNYLNFHNYMGYCIEYIGEDYYLIDLIPEAEYTFQSSFNKTKGFKKYK